MLVSVDAVIVGPLGPRTFTIRDPQFLDPDGDVLVVMAAPLIVTAVERVPVRVIGRLHPAKSHDDALQPPVNPPFPGEPPQCPIIVAESVVAGDGKQLAQKPEARGKATTLAAAARAERSELVGRVVEAHEVRVLQTRGDGMFWIGAGEGGASVPRLLVVPASPPASAVEAKGPPRCARSTAAITPRIRQYASSRAPTRDERVYLYATIVRVK